MRRRDFLSLAGAAGAVWSVDPAKAATGHSSDRHNPPQGSPAEGTAPTDLHVVSAKIHPAIGIARVGDSETEYFVGPEVTGALPLPAAAYRDRAGALKRQAARFRIFGYNQHGEAVAELTPKDAAITWTVELANKKAAWYRFIAAMDLPDAAGMKVPLRNASVTGAERASLIIRPGPRSIGGLATEGPAYRFDGGKFQSESVELGELRTDGEGRLLVLGGHGRSGSPGHVSIYNPADPGSFGNADGWFDDTSDGPVSATVELGGRPIPVTGAWVVVGPPNYAPAILSWRTLDDLLTELFVGAGAIKAPPHVSFRDDIYPSLLRLSGLQWVNQAFSAIFGFGGPFDFTNPGLVRKLAEVPDPATNADPWRALRQEVFNAFRPPDTSVDEPRLWPWIYGDAIFSFDEHHRQNNLALTPERSQLIERWAKGDFVNDWRAADGAATIDAVPEFARPAMLDKAALQFCAADAFHPGCELSWPMRALSLYAEPFRIRQRERGRGEPDYGPLLTKDIVDDPAGPLWAQGPGDLTRWMAVPWQADTAGCRSGYDPDFDPFMPTFWAARVPNHVISEEKYRVVVDPSRPRAARLAAWNTRVSWFRGLDGLLAEQMLQMVSVFSNMGIVAPRPGVPGDPDFPATMFVETRPLGEKLAAGQPAPVPRRSADAVTRAGWESRTQLAEFRKAKSRGRTHDV